MSNRLKTMCNVGFILKTVKEQRLGRGGGGGVSGAAGSGGLEGGRDEPQRRGAAQHQSTRPGPKSKEQKVTNLPVDLSRFGLCFWMTGCSEDGGISDK